MRKVLTHIGLFFLILGSLIFVIIAIIPMLIYAFMQAYGWAIVTTGNIGIRFVYRGYDELKEWERNCKK